ncbi:MAG TPA: NADP-dependent oxidoreductase [Candidatus Binatia bacterium]|nr:NADP-dependent oxidoreductase [Candidatus Binatia bacterium]
MAETNRKWVLRSRPQGMPGPENFELREDAVPQIADGQFLVRTLYLSCDPAQRAWMSRDTYVPMIPIGDVMHCGATGRVAQSKHPGFRVGDLVSGMFGWQDYAVSDGRGFMPVTKLPPGVPIASAMSALGVTGLTAYFGMLDVGKPKPGDGVLVSGAAGATGSIAAQIAKIHGARVVGIAGGADKCAWLTGEVGLDAAIDYRSERVARRIHELFPKGVAVYFDNVGGEILDAALGALAVGGRIVLCGAISSYNATELPPGPRNYTNLIVRRGRMEGFLVTDYAARFGEAVGDLAGWAAAGKLRDRVDVVDGLENAPDALRRLFTGENLGKQLVRVAEPPEGR